MSWLRSFWSAPTLLRRNWPKSVCHRRCLLNFNLQNDDVRVQASPGAKIFLGDIDAVTVHATNFMAGDLKFANFDSNLYGVHFQPLQALVYQELRVTASTAGI